MPGKGTHQNLEGMVFNYLTVLSFSHMKDGRSIWNVKCKCGKELKVRGNSLLTGNTESCGCKIKDNEYPFEDLSGKRYGRWTVVSRAWDARGVSFNVVCDCGTKAIVRGHTLKDGESKSCGCLRKELQGNRMRKHGMTFTKMYRTWNAMKNRCYLKSHPAYKNYGGRGITVCDRWKDSFENFYEDMKEGFDEHLEKHGSRNTSIDRIDNEKGYYKENCRWATMGEQLQNKRNRK